VNNAQVTATGVNVQAAGAYSLLISTDSKTWGTTTEMDKTLAKLTPVSTVGEINQGTVSDGATTDDGAKAIALAEATTGANATAAVGIGDGTEVAVGDVRFVTNIGWADNYVTTVSEVSRSSKDYFYSDTLYLKAAQEGNIYLDSTGIGIVWAAWDDTNHKLKDPEFTTLDEFMKLTAATTTSLADDTLKNANAYNENLASAQALLKTLRVGLLVTQTGTDSNSNPTYARTWHEYELASTTISDDNAINTTLKDGSGADGISKAVSALSADNAPATKTEPVVAEISGKKMSSGQTILDYALAGTETGLAMYETGADLLAEAAANEVVQVDVYIWMEGCDWDTVAANINSFADANIGGFRLGFCLGEAASS
jgi:hypothetical protein